MEEHEQPIQKLSLQTILLLQLHVIYDNKHIIVRYLRAQQIHDVTTKINSQSSSIFRLPIAKISSRDDLENSLSRRKDDIE